MAFRKSFPTLPLYYTIFHTETIFNKEILFIGMVPDQNTWIFHGFI